MFSLAPWSTSIDNSGLHHVTHFCYVYMSTTVYRRLGLGSFLRFMRNKSRLFGFIALLFDSILIALSFHHCAEKQQVVCFVTPLPVEYWDPLLLLY